MTGVVHDLLEQFLWLCKTSFGQGLQSNTHMDMSRWFVMSATMSWQVVSCRNGKCKRPLFVNSFATFRRACLRQMLRVKLRGSRSNGKRASAGWILWVSERTLNCASYAESITHTNTKTPVLKQSGQPASGAADSSSRWNRSSMLLNTSVSASRNTHFLNCVSRQQCSFVNVIPSSDLHTETGARHQ